MTHKHTYETAIMVRKYPLPLAVLNLEPTAIKEPCTSLTWVLPGFTQFNPEFLSMIRTEG